MISRIFSYICMRPRKSVTRFELQTRRRTMHGPSAACACKPRPHRGLVWSPEANAFQEFDVPKVHEITFTCMITNCSLGVSSCRFVRHALLWGLGPGAAPTACMRVCQQWRSQGRSSVVSYPDPDFHSCGWM